jgi:enoyl-CoA hydratase/carnithine racemase
VIDATGSDDTISYEVDNGVALVTLNRPDALNAVTMSMEHLLEDVLRRADHDPEVRCIIVTGAGRGFCAGDDVKVQWSDPAMRGAIERLASPRVGVTSMVDVLLRSSTPSVAAVNGPAVGFGMDLALMCDLRVASTDARFSQAYVRMGLVADLPGSWLLPRLVGPAMAAQLLLTGDTVDAATAQAIGLVSMVVPPDELIPAALGLARRIAANPPLAVAATKEGLRRGIGRGVDDLDDLAAIRGARLQRLFDTDDHREAVGAFAERRPGRFRGH